ncbi:hypothetical protein EVAR_57765_1 [Eumeta japonica]|uniref:Uncharacterized protein n=1 Tax=Eumeta variegata TaxID=151549 RepID=A0A4C1Y503_EUMVA|nr:hypothetical protein EVAR_57765_1 [Eumeta japonica]
MKEFLTPALSNSELWLVVESELKAGRKLRTRLGLKMHVGSGSKAGTGWRLKSIGKKSSTVWGFNRSAAEIQLSVILFIVAGLGPAPRAARVRRDSDELRAGGGTTPRQMKVATDLGWTFMVKLHPLPVFVTSLTSSNVVALIWLTICVRDVLVCGNDRRQRQCCATHDRD